MIEELLEELNSFPGREEALRKEFRWKNRTPMFYRPHLSTHAKHVAWLTDEVAPSVLHTYPAFDAKRAFALALVHDDPEIVTGDYTAGDKASMTKEQLQHIADEEVEAINTLAERFPKTLGGFSYEELLLDMVNLETIEAQVAKYMDRFDGYGEGVHEIYAGNKSFVGTVQNEFGLTPRFGELNVQLRTSMMDKFPLLFALQGTHMLFSIDPLPDFDTIVTTVAPHTRESLLQPTDCAQYDLWRGVILAKGTDEEILNLYSQKEFQT